MTTNEEGKTSANQRPSAAAREFVTRAIVRRLTFADWWLITVVTVAQIVVATALRVMPLATWRNVASGCRPFAQIVAGGSSERIAWAIEATGRRLGRFSTCLVRALVAELVLDAHQGTMTLTIGVRRTPSGVFQAHAWLAREDRVLVGATADEYEPLASWTTLPG